MVFIIPYLFAFGKYFILQSRKKLNRFVRCLEVNVYHNSKSTFFTILIYEKNSFLQLFIICVNIKLTNFFKSGYFVVSFNNGKNFTGAVIEKTKNFLKQDGFYRMRWQIWKYGLIYLLGKSNR